MGVGKDKEKSKIQASSKKQTSYSHGLLLNIKKEEEDAFLEK